ncbi:cytochrome P450 [Suillus paluster]|uniref:cytochrome P450 n=1 Tax=Suillus paluster TaxID=48578 RepID=UPI001B876E57|nr:cytochrome P450 [Suillus paluster]KAG1730697.1 cytochrome P450 [Suillus paluster]
MLQLPDLHASDNTQLVLGAAACLGLIGVISKAYLSKSQSGLPLPPTPPTWRLRGHFVPLNNPFLTVAAWIDQHGPLITIRSGFSKTVIVGRHNAAVEIMEKQGAFTADRPRFVAAGEMLFGGLSIIFTPVGSRLRRMRRALHSNLQPKVAEEYQPLQMSYAKETVLNILRDPYNFQNHAATYSATTIKRIAYGKTSATLATDPEVLEIREHLRVLRTTARPGAYLVESFPWLKHVPGYGRELKKGFPRVWRIYTSQLNRVKQQMQDNVDGGPSFVKYMLKNPQVHELSETEMAFLAGTFVTAGTETTSMAICTVFMAAACFPEEQAKVHAELDAIIGKDRAPTFADYQTLPRLQAFVSEALRWRPLAPSGVAHRTTQDVIWGNYCIPGGTTVVADHWSISRDPDVFPEPEAFKPQRWVNDQGRTRDDMKFYLYGFGRRVCPGQEVANRSLFINAALVLWAFQLTRDPTKPLNDMGYMNGAMDKIRPCAIEFKTRIPETELRHMMQNYPEAARD